MAESKTHPVETAVVFLDFYEMIWLDLSSCYNKLCKCNCTKNSFKAAKNSQTAG